MSIGEVERQRGRQAAVTWGGARQTAQRILSGLGRAVGTPDAAEGFADGLRTVAGEIDRIAREARQQAGGGEPLRPIPGDRVAQHRHIHGPECAVEWRETIGEVLAVVEESGAFGGWVALVRWPEMRGRDRYGVLNELDFSEASGAQRVRVVVEEVPGG